MKRLALLVVLALFAAPSLAEVCYKLSPNALSHAGNGHGCSPVKIDQSVQLPANQHGTEFFDALVARYGPCRTAGVRGWSDRWTEFIPQALAERFANRTATWNVADYSACAGTTPNGVPSITEIFDAYYSLDTKILTDTTGRPIPQPRPNPTPPVEPPAPVDPPVTPTPPLAECPAPQVTVEVKCGLLGKCWWVLRTEAGTIESSQKKLPRERAEHAARRVAALLGTRVTP